MFMNTLKLIFIRSSASFRYLAKQVKKFSFTTAENRIY